MLNKVYVGLMFYAASPRSATQLILINFDLKQI